MSTARTIQKQETHRKIFDTALHLFRTQGVEATSVDQIVQAAGVSKGSFFVHFPTKLSIFTTYVDHLTAALLPSLPQWLEMPPLGGLQQATDALTASVEQDWELIPYIIQAELLGEPWDDKRPTALQQIFGPLVARSQSAGALRHDLSMPQIVDHLLSTYFIALIWGFRHGDPLGAALALPMRLALDGVRPRPGEGQP